MRTTAPPRSAWIGHLAEVFRRFQALAARFPRDLVISPRMRSRRAQRLNEILVVDNDLWYRDRVLIPSLESVGFVRLHRARSVSSGIRQLNCNPGVSILVTDVVLARGEDAYPVCQSARRRKMRLVVLSSLSEVEVEVHDLADAVMIKRQRSVLETVREIRRVANRGRCVSQPRKALVGVR